VTDTWHAPPDATTGARLTTDRIGLGGLPDRLQLLPGTTIPLALLVSNRGRVVDQFTLAFQGVDPAWVNITVGEATLMPDADAGFELTIRIPDQPPPPAEVYTLLLGVSSRAEPDVLATAEIALEVMPVGGLELELRPLLVRTRRSARYTAHVKNLSNASHSISLIVQDPNEVLDLTLGTNHHTLDIGATKEVEVRARPRKRYLIGPPAAYNFRVLALPATEGAELAEPLAGTDGTLIYQPALAFLAFIPPRLRRLWLALLLLLALAALLIWLLFGPGSRIAGPQPAPTPVPTPATAAAASKVEPTVAPPASAAQEPSPEATKPPLPTIDRFEVVTLPTPGAVEYQITWDVSGADEVKLRGQPRPSHGTEPITSLVDDTFELEATNAGGTVKKSIGILILRPPEVLTLTADKAQVAPGDAVKLTWTARGGQRASLDGGSALSPQAVDPRAGTVEVRPRADASYTLTVENELGRATRTISVRVEP
jgi:hypothetical protein